MLKDLRKKIFGPTKKEQEELARKKRLEEMELKRKSEELERRRKYEEQEKIKKITDEYNKLKNSAIQKELEFKNSYANILLEGTIKGYLAEDIERKAENGEKIPAGFPYIFWSDTKLEELREAFEKVYEMEDSTDYLEKSEARTRKFEDEEKTYKEAVSRHWSICHEKYPDKTEFKHMELGYLRSCTVFDKIMENNTWKRVVFSVKDVLNEDNELTECINSKVDELKTMVSVTPKIFLSLDEKYKYYNKYDIEQRINELEKQLGLYNRDIRSCEIPRRHSMIKNYQENIQSSMKYFNELKIPVYKELIPSPLASIYPASEQNKIKKLPEYNEIFNLFPYNIHSQSPLSTSKDNVFYSGHIFLGELFKKYLNYRHYPNNSDRETIRDAIKSVRELLPSYLNEYKAIKLGVKGETLVKEEFDKFDDMTINLYNIRLENEGMSIETDSIIIAPNGIFSVEVKNLGSEGQYELVITNDGQWRKRIPEKGIDEPYNDVYSQGMNHVNGTRRLLKRKLQENENSTLKDREIFVQPIIVIANNEVTINNSSEQVILRASNVYNYIFNTFQGKMNLSRREMEEIRSILLEEKLESKKYPINDVKKITDTIAEVLEHENRISSLYNILENNIMELVTSGQRECESADKSLGLSEVFYSRKYIEERIIPFDEVYKDIRSRAVKIGKDDISRSNAGVVADSHRTRMIAAIPDGAFIKMKDDETLYMKSSNYIYSGHPDSFIIELMPIVSYVDAGFLPTSHFERSKLYDMFRNKDATIEVRDGAFHISSKGEKYKVESCINYLRL